MSDAAATKPSVANEEDPAKKASFLESLRADVGKTTGAPLPARDAVNQAMIRHWSDAMEDFNPCYIDPEFAAKSIHGEIVAPPAMLNAWGMAGLHPRRRIETAGSRPTRNATPPATPRSSPPTRSTTTPAT